MQFFHFGTCLFFPAMTGYKHLEDEMNQLKKTTQTGAIQFKFHPNIGKNIMLLEDGLHARRIDPDHTKEYAIVYGDWPIPHRGRCIFEVVITEYEEERTWEMGEGLDHLKYIRSIRIGVMKLRPAGIQLKHFAVPRWSEHCDRHCVWDGVRLWNRFSGDFTLRAYGKPDFNGIKKGDHFHTIIVSSQVNTHHMHYLHSSTCMRTH